MKNKIYYIGLVTCIIVTAGSMFKIMHWPGANIGITFGILSLCLVFIPASFVSSFREEANKKLKLLYILAAIIIALDNIGALFKIMHWPGANILLIVTLPLPFVVLLPAYLWSKRNDAEMNYNNLLAILFFFAYYAAISSLLALGVQRNVLDGFTQSAKSIEQKTEVFTQECNSLCLNNTDTLSKQHINIKKQADVICNKIEELKRVIIINASGCQSVANKTKNYIDIDAIKFKDSHPNAEPFYVDRLKTELQNYKSLLNNSKSLPNSYIDKIFNTSDDVDNLWTYKFFQNTILVSAIKKLNMLQYQVRFTEYEALTLVD